MRKFSTYSNLFVLFILSTMVLSCSKTMSEQEIVNCGLVIHGSVWTIDTHCDTPMDMVRDEFDPGVRHDIPGISSSKVDFPGMIQGGLDAQFFACYVPQRERNKLGYINAKAIVDQAINAVEASCNKYVNLAEIAFTPQDAVRLEKMGKRAIYLGIENGFAVGKNKDLVSYFYNRGICYITLCHSRNNDICDSSTDEGGLEWNGLSPFGEEVVQEMNRLGMIIDVSHISDSSFYDVLQRTKAPVMASHSCCRALCNHPRNLSDDMLMALAENGGVIQICFVGDYLKEILPNPEVSAEWKALREKYGNHKKITDPDQLASFRLEERALFEKYPECVASVKDVVDHIDHVVQLVGEDYVGIGTDFDGGGEVLGAYDVSELPNVTIELVRRGYSEEQIRKIWGGNFMRVFREVERVSEVMKED